MKRTVLIGLILLSASRLIAGERAVSLAGTWGFQLDRADAGVSERWFERTLMDRVHLPGDLSEQGIGDPPSLKTKWIGGVHHPWYLQPELARYSTPENFKFPFWLTPERHYVGAAWYQREIEVPQDWTGRRVVLTLERPHWETRVWLDGTMIGTNNALGAPHEYDLGQLRPGKHRLTVRVDNRMIVDVGENSHSVSDHTQGDWNGIVGGIELRATPLVWIEDLQVYPQVASRSVRIKGRIGNVSNSSGKGTLTLNVGSKAGPAKGDLSAKTIPVTWEKTGGSFECEFPLGQNAGLWDEFNPAVYRLSAVLRMENSQTDRTTHSVETVFGLREVGTQGTQFVVNGRKTFFRGTLECAIFPRTGHPPTDFGSWEKIMRTCRAHGLNMIRFHSWCPPEAAFNAADEFGFYLQVECSSWANQSTTLGDGKPVDAWIYQEADRILKHYGNHPSFLLMLYGNEPGGPNHSAYLAKWVNEYKARDSRRLYSSGSGWPQIAENQFHVTPDPRIQLWGQGLKSRINALPPATTTDYRDYIGRRKVPVISHEIGQWCVYPNFDEISKYTGYLKARNFEIFRDSLKAHHMGDEAHRFLLASGKLQTLCYKEDIESALRTPGMGGFQLLDLHDFPGQGTALVGVLDPFWESKGYVTAAEYSRFCNSTVPLARLPKRVFTTDETLEADLEVAHFGAEPINAETKWKLVDSDGKTIVSGVLPAKDVPVDNGIALGHISVPLNAVAGPQQCKLVVSVEGTVKPQQKYPTRFENDWDIWIYRTTVDSTAPADVTIVDDLNDSAIAKLNAGGKVLLLIPPARVANMQTNKVALGFSSIFWNTAWTQRQAPTTLGILCDPKHPALAEFPTEFHSNWQWWYLVSRAGTMILDDFPAKLRPTVQVIDDWVTNHRLALLFEANVGGGRLMVCSVDLKNNLESDPVRRQFRHSILSYMKSRRFSPKVSVSADLVRRLITPIPAGLQVVSIKADSEETGYEASNVIDSDPETLWHTTWSEDRQTHPHELRLEFKEPIAISGVTLLPRQDGNRNGWIRDYECYVSDDGENWSEPVAKGMLNADGKLKTITFPKTVRSRFLRLVALSGFGQDRFTSIAEFGIIQNGKPVQTLSYVSPAESLAAVPQIPITKVVPGNPSAAENVLEIMERVADWQLGRPMRYAATDWTYGALYTGFMALDSVSPARRFREAMLSIGETNQWKLGPNFFSADDHCVGQMYSELWFRYRDPKMIEPMKQQFDAILAKPSKVTSFDFRKREAGEIWSWCDSLFMAPPAWVRLAAVTGDHRYLNFAVTNWWRTSDFLYDTNEHLFFRDNTYFNKREANGAKVFWGRGNGWVMGGLVRVLEFLPADHPSRGRFIQQFREMSEKILGCQQPDGLWRSSLLDPEHYSLTETSGSGFYTYALAWGINHGLLERARFAPAVEKAWQALAGCVASDGKLTHVQPVGADPRRFNVNHSDVYGVGAFLLAGSEVYQLNGGKVSKSLTNSVSNASLPIITDADFQTLVSRCREMVLKTDSDAAAQKPGELEEAKIQGWMTALNADGSWPDINYQDRDRAFWRTAGHLVRTRFLARALVDPDHPLHGNVQLEAATLRALDFWLAKRFQSANWWWNRIGVPGPMADIIALLDQKLTDKRRAAALEVLEQAGRPKSGSGANTIWIADLALQYGALTRNAALVEECSGIIAQEIRFTTEEGIQPDYSFHQHWARLQQFSYGRPYLVTATRLAWELRDTPWSIPQNRLRILADFVLQGDQWMSRGIYTVPSTLDRSASRPGILKWGDVRRPLEQLRELVPDRAAELNSFLARQNGKGEPLVGAKAFPRSDFTVFHRPAFSIFLKTISDRTLPAEVGLNGENLKGTLQNWGDHYLMRDGQEYFDLAPVWDWNLLPGVTFAEGAGKPQGQSFAGAVTDGESFAAVMDFQSGTKEKMLLSGRKFWVGHGDMMIGLISDLNVSDVTAPVRTALDQCRLRGPVTICDPSGKLRALSQNETNITVRWIQHAGFAYAPLGGLRMSVRAEPATGSWQSINKAQSSEPITVPVFLPVLEHGTAPARAVGGYVITSGSVAEAEKIFTSPTWRVMRNEGAIQAVAFGDGTVAAAFHEAGSLNQGKESLTTDRPCIILQRANRLWITDPTQRGGIANLVWKGKPCHIGLPADGSSFELVADQ